MIEHAVVIAGGGPTGMILAAELALAKVDVAILERRTSPALPGSRAGGLHARTVEMLDQRGIAERFLAEGQKAPTAGFASVRFALADLPTRHPYILGLWQNHFERILAGWIVRGVSPEHLLDTYHRERHPVAARVLRDTMAQVALSRTEDRAEAMRDLVSELLRMEEPRRSFAARMSGLDVHYALGDGHPLIGRRMPDLDLDAVEGPERVHTLLHEARPILLNFGEAGGLGIPGWADRVRVLDARYEGRWDLPGVGVVPAPAAVLIRPDGYVAWAGDSSGPGLTQVLTEWFGG